MTLIPESTSESGHPFDERCVSGVEGLDAILDGGLPKNCFYVIQGDPGSGKTTLALQFLLEGVRRGEIGLYVTLSETKRELTKVTRSHGWSLAGLSLVDFSAVEELVRPQARTTVFRSSEVELGKFSDLVLQRLEGLKPARVVFDSLSEFRLIAESPLRYRRQLLVLKQAFARHGSTVLLLDDRMDADGQGPDPHILSLTHGVIDLEQLSPDYGTSRRRLRVRKLRGVKFREGYHDYVIEHGGVRVFPRLEPSDHRRDYQPEPVGSGVPALDQMLGGGVDRGTTTLIAGAAGTGKSTLALQFVAERAREGEHGLVFTFDETRSLLLSRADGLGLPLRRHVADGTVIVQQVDPAELSPGEFALRVVKGVEAGARIVVIDSLNGYLNAMPGEHYLNSQLHELCSFLNQHHIITILILAQQEGGGEPVVNVSFLADTVVAMRFFAAFGEMKLAIAVTKKRSGWHEKAIRELALIAGKGLEVGKPIKLFPGILAGIPAFGGSARQATKAHGDVA